MFLGIIHLLNRVDTVIETLQKPKRKHNKHSTVSCTDSFFGDYSHNSINNPGFDSKCDNRPRNKTRTVTGSTESFRNLRLRSYNGERQFLPGKHYFSHSYPLQSCVRSSFNNIYRDCGVAFLRDSEYLQDFRGDTGFGSGSREFPVDNAVHEKSSGDNTRSFHGFGNSLVYWRGKENRSTLGGGI